MNLPKLSDSINFTKNTPLDEIIETSMIKWMKKNLSTSGVIKKDTTKLEIFIDGKKTGWYIAKDNYSVTNDIGYNTTAFAKLQCYKGFEQNLKQLTAT